MECFNRRREANPLATDCLPECLKFLFSVSIADAKPIPWRRKFNQIVVYNADFVSIADAKPIPWRRKHKSTLVYSMMGFNRRREANPLATRRAGGGQIGALKVSIADAKPIPWRPRIPRT